MLHEALGSGTTDGPARTWRRGAPGPGGETGQEDGVPGGECDRRGSQLEKQVKGNGNVWREAIAFVGVGAEQFPQAEGFQTAAMPGP